MAYFRDSNIRRIARTGSFSVDARTTLSTESRRAVARSQYDIFLSHASLDAEQVLGVKRKLESGGRTVYVDWYDDPQLDRTRVDASTAGVLRSRMRVSDSFIFATSVNSPNSKWMPWELGYFDGFRSEKIAIFPLVGSSDDEYRGQEYLGLYPEFQEFANVAEPVLIDASGGRYATLSSFASRNPTSFNRFRS